MNRERIELNSEDVQQLLYGDNILDYRWVDDEVTYTDMEKGFQYRTLIIQRGSDNKYFMAGDVLDSSYHSPDDTVFEEVIKKVETKTVEVITWE